MLRLLHYNLLQYLLLIFAATLPEHVTVDGRDYEVKADVKSTVCDDQHSNPCHPRAKGVRREEEAQVMVKDAEGKPVALPFPQICKTAGCAEDSREEWVRTAIRRQPK